MTISKRAKIPDKLRKVLTNLDSTGGSGGAVDWIDVTGKPATFPPETHTHPTSAITGLDTALAGKASTVHTHVTADVTGLDTALSGKQATLVSGTNIKTINGSSVLGAGDLVVSSATNLSYTAATRIIASDTGTDATLPLVTTGDAGLAPASGGGTTNFLRADGTWAAPPSGGGGGSPILSWMI